MILTEPAYGKLNLALDVLGTRPDGYHEMRMIMQSVALHDTVTLELGTGRPWTLDCYRPTPAGEVREDYPQDERNLAWKAARAFCEAAQVDPEGLTITVCKRIPVQAGMAGGSSDGAAVLRGLNRAYGERFTTEALCQLAQQIGSDVPYCVLGGTALAEGRGEVLTALPPMPKLWFVLCKPDFAVSTPTLFRAIDDHAIDQRPDIDAMLASIHAGDGEQIGALLVNVFQPVANAQYPVVERICGLLREQGALGAQMTGTGSVVFGLFASQEQAEAAAAALAPEVLEVLVTVPV